MKSLLLKDFYMIIKYCKSFFFIIAVFIVSSFLDVNNMFFNIYPIMISSIIPLTLLSYDEKDRWLEYSAGLPYSRAQIVSAKYLIGLGFGAMVFVVSMIAMIIRMVIDGVFDIFGLLSMGGVLIILGLVGPSLVFPCIFKMGTEKGRLMFYVMIGFSSAVAAAISAMDFELTFIKGNFIIPIIAAIVIAAYIISWRLSILFFEKREL